jgi:hypothetical protein
MGDVAWSWGQEEKIAFEGLKSAVTTVPVLALPNDDGAYRLECDSSNFATGGVLSQQQNGKWRPLGFLSKLLSDVERKYDIHDKELLAIIRALEEWRPHLLGTTEPFEIWTDHKNLEYFRSSKKLNRRQARWSLTLADYNFVIVHKPGKSMTKVDALSRRTGHQRGSGDNADYLLLKPEHFRAIQSNLEPKGVQWLEEIRGKEVERWVRECVAKGLDGWSEVEGLILWEG